jgi:hypothetical protein
MNTINTLKDLHVLLAGIYDDATRLAHNAGAVISFIEKTLTELNTEKQEP